MISTPSTKKVPQVTEDISNEHTAEAPPSIAETVGEADLAKLDQIKTVIMEELSAGVESLDMSWAQVKSSTEDGKMSFWIDVKVSREVNGVLVTVSSKIELEEGGTLDQSAP